MTKELKMLVGVAMFAALALAGALGIFAFSAGFQPVSAQSTQRRRHQELQRRAAGGDRWDCDCGCDYHSVKRLSSAEGHGDAA